MLFLGQHCILCLILTTTLPSYGQSVSRTDVPIATLVLGEHLDEKFFVEGFDIYFTCMVGGNSRAGNISWEHNGVKIEDNVEGFRLSENSLVLQKLSPRFNGQYTCRASNGGGTGVSPPYDLRIRHKPMCKNDEPMVISAKLLEPVKIDCEVEAFPSVDAFQWTFSNSSGHVKKINNDSFTVAKEQGRSVLTYTPTSEADYGTMGCLAANTQGQQTSPCTFVIHPPPEVPRYCRLYPANSQKVLLMCNPGITLLQFKENITYRAEILTDDGKKALQNTTLPFWVVDNFDNSLSWKIVLYAKNEYGEAKRTFTEGIAYELTSSD